jgi:clan AA aspartic protease (TIGR02281 family)
MRNVLVAILLAALLAAWIAPAGAASLDPSRIAAIDRAADAFLAKATEAHKSRRVPRQSDPEIGPLLDTVFNTDDLSHGPVDYADFPRLSDWLGRITSVGKVYTSAAREVHDIGVFGAEIGRFYDASVTILQAMTDCMAAELNAHPEVKLSSADQQSLPRMRSAISETLGLLLDMFRAPGLSVGWVHERLQVLIAAAPSMARFLATEQIARLRATLRDLAARIRDKALRGELAGLAGALAAPPPPVMPAEAAKGGAEIALEGDGRAYWVPVRVNGAATVKFLVDSGASVVVLPSDLVETLTKSGAIAPSDLLGKDTYVTADGRRHKGTQLMLRELDVGGHRVANVIASVAPAKADPLLGQTFLAKFKSWTLDNRRHVLVIAE